MILVEGGLYFDTHNSTCAVIQCTEVTEYEYHLVIVKCNESKFVGLNGTVYKDSAISLVPLTPLLEKLI